MPRHFHQRRRKFQQQQQMHQAIIEAAQTLSGIYENPETNVGQRLRQLRVEQGLSIRALADQSGLNVNTLSLIENGKSSPSVGTLQQLANTLNVPIVSFFEKEIVQKKVVHVIASQRPRVSFTRGYLEELGSSQINTSIEPFVITLETDAESSEQPIVHTGFEFVYCLEGQINYSINDQEYVLNPGDSLLFEAHLPHRWWNPDNAVSRSLLVLCPADERDQPTNLHFVPSLNQ